MIVGGSASVFTMDLIGSMVGKALDRLHFADRGNLPRFVHISHFDPNGKLVGFNAYTRGDQNSGLKTEGEIGGSVFGYDESLQKLTPTPDYQGVPLGMVEVRAFSNNNQFIAFPVRHHRRCRISAVAGPIADRGGE